MNSIFNDKNTDVVLLIDAENAFSLVNREAFMHSVKIICPAFATFVSNCYFSSSRRFIIGGGELKFTEGAKQGDLIAMIIYAIATTSLILMIIKIMYDRPGNTTKLVAYADNFTAAGTLTELKVLWNILIDLRRKFRYYPQASKSWLIIKKYRIKRASILSKPCKINIVSIRKKHLGAVIVSVKQ